MRRTQLYLDQQLWDAVRVQARASGSTISELVRVALREKYLGGAANRQSAMRAFVGIRADRSDVTPTETYLRSLRKGNRLTRISH